ncbi:MAG: phytanoyl-CoA dioxygenase family protein [Planctomycetes bacterium]|nr:phytanoyl-CoA dioxygenase family protein [Planctomycetota bacterium]
MAVSFDLTQTRTPSNQHLGKSGPGRIRICNADPIDVKYHTDLESSMHEMEETGLVVFKSLLNTEETAVLRQRMDDIGGDIEQYRNQGHYGETSDEAMQAGSINKHVGTPFALDGDFLEYFDRPEAIDLIESIHGQGTRVIGGSVWITGPGRYPMGLHIDYQPIGLPPDVAMDPRVKVPIMISTLHYYLNDMYQELGPTIVVPGSHRAGRAPNGETHWNGIHAQALECKAGDAMLFRSDLWHGALPNCSEETRYMLQVHFGTPYMCGSFNGLAKKQDIDQNIIDRATPRQRRLLGEREAGDPGSYLVDAAIREEDKKVGVFVG